MSSLSSFGGAGSIGQPRPALARRATPPGSPWRARLACSIGFSRMLRSWLLDFGHPMGSRNVSGSILDRFWEARTSIPCGRRSICSVFDKSRLFRSRHRFDHDFDRSGARLDDPGPSFVRPGTSLGGPGRSWDAPGVTLGALLVLLGRSWALSGGVWPPQEGPWRSLKRFWLILEGCSDRFSRRSGT